MNELTKAPAQTNMFGILDQSINRVYSAEPIIKDGAEIGTTVKMMKRKDIAVLNGLNPKKDKEKLDEIMEKSSDDVLNMIKGEVSKLNGDWTAGKNAIRFRSTKDGEKELVIRLKTISRAQNISDEKLAKFMFPDVQYPTMTLAEKVAKIVAMRESQKAQLAKPTETIETEQAAQS